MTNQNKTPVEWQYWTPEDEPEGLFLKLSERQKKEALAYDGPINIGSDEFRTKPLD